MLLFIVSSLLSFFPSIAKGHYTPHKLSRYNVTATKIALSTNYSITVSPNTDLVDGSWVSVSYSTPSPLSTDLVLAYSPLPVNLSEFAPIEYFFPSEIDPSYLQTGLGSLPARLVNMRQPYTFVLATGGLANPVAVAISTPVTFSNYNQPKAPRIAMTGVTTEMRISWSSSSIMNPSITIGISKDNSEMYQSLPATSSITWAATDMCGPPATTFGYREPGYVHSVVVTDLTPGLSYTYSVGDDTERSQPFTFTQPSSTNFPFSISVVGDMGSNSIDRSVVERAFPPAPNSTRLIAADVSSGLSHAVLHCGDISYSCGYQAAWEYFLDSISGINDIASRVPYHVNLGNHEADAPNSWPSNDPSWANGTDSGGECAVPSTNLFPMPGALGNASKLWWAAAIGPIFTVHFSSELDTTPGGEMHTFVRDALASVNRSITPWVIVGTHRPIVISSTNDAPDGGDTTVAAVLRNNMAPLFANAGGEPVDIVLAGHHHSYQRHAGLTGSGPAPGGVGNLTIAVPCPTGPGVPIYKGGIAPVYFDIGTGGAGFSLNIIFPQPEWACLVEWWHGFGRITAENSSALHWEFINDLDGSISDEAWIIK